LKQRREIVGGSALYIDQAPVRAALEGKVLILDGIEKAERNVLPTLNNLLGMLSNAYLLCENMLYFVVNYVHDVTYYGV
jgi:hypothetical protein